MRFFHKEAVGVRVRSLKTLYEGRALVRGKEYEVLSIENGWYRIICELGEDYLFPPECLNR